MSVFFKKTVLFAIFSALAVASLPLAGVFAAGQFDLAAPQSSGQVASERLEKIWARQLRRYERLARVDEFIDRVQHLLDRAAANGKDVSAVQAALDAFAKQWKQAKPIYESMHGIVNSQQGFDKDGTVTNPEKAKETVMAMHEKFQEIRTLMNGAGKALREAIQAYRQANPRPRSTATP